MMSNASEGDRPTSGREAAAGQLLLQIAQEWQRVQTNEPDSPARAILRSAYGALALQLGVRAGELGPFDSALDILTEAVADYRKDLAASVATIKR